MGIWLPVMISVLGLYRYRISTDTPNNLSSYSPGPMSAFSDVSASLDHAVSRDVSFNVINNATVDPITYTTMSLSTLNTSGNVTSSVETSSLATNTSGNVTSSVETSSLATNTNATSSAQPPEVTSKECSHVLCQTEPGHYAVNVSACAADAHSELILRGQVTVVIAASSTGLQAVGQCKWTMKAPWGLSINVTIGQLFTNDGNPDGNFSLTFSTEQEGRRVFNHSILTQGTVTVVSSRMLSVELKSAGTHMAGALTIQFVPVKGVITHTLPVTRVSQHVSFVNSPRFDGVNNTYPAEYTGVFHLNIASNQSVFVSFVHFALESGERSKCVYDHVTLTVLGENRKWKKCDFQNIPLAVYRSSLKLLFHSDPYMERAGFKMMFSVLARSQEPQLLSVDVLNCSVSYFHTLQPMLNCNMQTECEHGQDEENCVYYGDDCEDGDIDAGRKCYKLFREHNVTWTGASTECTKNELELAMLPTAEEFRTFQQVMVSTRNVPIVYIGAHLVSRPHTVSVAMSAIYRNVWQWMDERTAFVSSAGGGCFYTCAAYQPGTPSGIQLGECHKHVALSFFCEYEKSTNATANETSTSATVIRDPGSLNDSAWKVRTVRCGEDYVTREFLSCGSRQVCGGGDSMTSCEKSDTSMPQFLCSSSKSALHFTLVCDFIPHCTDESDETFCVFPPCPSTQRSCGNGQCISKDQFCDGKMNCYDGSDELRCHTKPSSKVTDFLAPGVYSIDDTGQLSFRKMKEGDHCPDTHFQCPHGHCSPVYLRCNGIPDCPGREDEAGCECYVCPGLYRCQGTAVCLFAVHVCDGVFHCPRYDDELLCEEACPDACLCQGLVFLCTSTFSATSYTAVRYLDVSGTGMNPVVLADNVYLIHLIISSCQISFLPSLKLPNLIHIDLSWNSIEFFDITQFQQLENLRVLILSGNPLTEIADTASTTKRAMKLWKIDISQSELGRYNGSALARLPAVKILNISHSRLTTITDEGFLSTPMLETLDLRGSPLHIFPNGLLKHLISLKVVHTDNYLLCCRALLPVEFDSRNCHAKQDLLASCEDLLKDNTYRVFLWVFSSLTLVGNLGSFAGRLYLQSDSSSLSSFSVFVTCLAVSDFFMGVYLAMIGVADLMYHGEYLWHHRQWKNSVTCSIAGFFSVTSSEVSAFLICLITLDRFLVLCFPFSSMHFNRSSAVIACGIVWTVGTLLAAIPLLPVTSFGNFYSQTGICIPFPFMDKDAFPGYIYSFSIMIILNSVVFLLIAVGQVTIYLSVRSNSMSSGRTTASRDLTIARRLTTIVVSDFLCWFPIGLLGVLASTGVSIPDELNVAVAIFVLPFNSALNPFLYTINVILEKRCKQQEHSMLKQLESRLHSLHPYSDKLQAVLSVQKIDAD